MDWTMDIPLPPLEDDTILDFDLFLMPFSEDEAVSSERHPLCPTVVSDVRTRKKKARTLRKSDWEPYRERIIQLHITENRTLPQVMNLIKEEFGFTAEQRQYRYYLSRQLKVDKNTKAEEMQAIVGHHQQRSLIETDKPGLRFRVRGKEVETQKIQRWMKSHDVIESMIYAPSPVASTPSAVSYATVSECGSPSLHPLFSHRVILDIEESMDDGHTDPRLSTFYPSSSSLLEHVVDDHTFAKWRYQYGQHDNDASFLIIPIVISQSSLDTETLRRTAMYLGTTMAQAFVKSWIRSRFPRTVEKRIFLHFYVRKILPVKSDNVRVYVQIPLKFSSRPWSMGIEFITSCISKSQCEVAWTSGMFNPVDLSDSLVEWRIFNFPWRELQSFTWPGDDID